MTAAISHSHIIGLRVLYNFVKYCKYDSGSWGMTGLTNFGCGRKRFHESLAATYHSLTWRSPSFLCLAMLQLRFIPLLSQRGFVMCLLSGFKRFDPQPAGERPCPLKHFITGIYGVFLLCHVVTMNCDFHCATIVKEDEGLACRCGHEKDRFSWSASSKPIRMFDKILVAVIFLLAVMSFIYGHFHKHLCLSVLVEYKCWSWCSPTARSPREFHLWPSRLIDYNQQLNCSNYDCLIRLALVGFGN